MRDSAGAQELEMALREGFGADAFGFGLALGVLLGDPGGPGFAVGGVFAGESDRLDVGVGDDLRRFAALGENLDAGRSGAGVAIEEVAFDRLATDGQRHVAAVIESLVDPLEAILLGLEGEDGTLERGVADVGSGLDISGHGNSWGAFKRSRSGGEGRLGRLVKAGEGTEGRIDRRGLETAMDHAVLALGIVALVAVVVPVGQLHVFLERLHVAVLEEVARLLPAEDVVGGAAPRGALEIEIALEELEEEGREVELPALLRVLEDLLEEVLAVVAVEELVLVRRLLVDVAGGEHHALDAEVHRGVEEVTDMLRIDAGEEGRVGRHAKAALHRLLDRLDGGVVGAVAADRHVVLFLQAVEVDGEGEVLGGLEEIELAFK